MTLVQYFHKLDDDATNSGKASKEKYNGTNVDILLD